MPEITFTVEGLGLDQLVEALKNTPEQNAKLFCETAAILKIAQDARRFRVIVEALLVGTPESLQIIDTIAGGDKEVKTFDELRVVIDEAIAHHAKR